tara:strand:+ start:1152 stop:2126 length:975 start_codon:yes stop_codon:yes gene_type:complete
MKNKYQILLYYYYVKINNPQKFKQDHHLFCIKNNIKGRIIISSEGINGTVSGKKNDCEKYMNHLNKNKLFKDLDFKVEEYNSNAFNKINVRLKNEIVNSGINDDSILDKKGQYIEPSDFKTILEDLPDDVTILDVRSNYEHSIGRFNNALTLNIENFRDFPDKISELKRMISKKNKIITYCTGGVKCEKASAYLMKNGYENVYQLHGGIIKYGIEENGKNFQGKCYVFDNRIVKDINKVNPKVIGRCYITGERTDRMVNCANSECNRHFTLSEEGAKKYKGCCSKDCMESGSARNYNGTGFYQKKLNGYNPYIGYRDKLTKKKN